VSADTYHVVTKDKCPLCQLAKSLLHARGLHYTEQYLESKSDIEAFKKANPDIRMMPVVYVNGTRIGGWSDLRTYLS